MKYECYCGPHCHCACHHCLYEKPEQKFRLLRAALNRALCEVGLSIPDFHIEKNPYCNNPDRYDAVIDSGYIHLDKLMKETRRVGWSLDYMEPRGNKIFINGYISH